MFKYNAMHRCTDLMHLRNCCISIRVEMAPFIACDSLIAELRRLGNMCWCVWRDSMISAK